MAPLPLSSPFPGVLGPQRYDHNTSNHIYVNNAYSLFSNPDSLLCFRWSTAHLCFNSTSAQLRWAVVSQTRINSSYPNCSLLSSPRSCSSFAPRTGNDVILCPINQNRKINHPWFFFLLNLLYSIDQLSYKFDLIQRWAHKLLETVSSLLVCYDTEGFESMRGVCTWVHVFACAHEHFSGGRIHSRRDRGHFRVAFSRLDGLPKDP